MQNLPASPSVLSNHLPSRALTCSKPPLSIKPLHTPPTPPTPQQRLRTSQLELEEEKRIAAEMALNRLRRKAAERRRRASLSRSNSPVGDGGLARIGAASPASPGSPDGGVGSGSGGGGGGGDGDGEASPARSRRPSLLQVSDMKGVSMIRYGGSRRRKMVDLTAYSTIIRSSSKYKGRAICCSVGVPLLLLVVVVVLCR